MKQNVGILDTAIRSVISIIMLALAAQSIFSPAINIALTVAGMGLWLSASFGTCFLYKMLGIDTYPNGGEGLSQH